MTLLYPVFIQVGLGVALLVVVGLVKQARRRRSLADFLGGPRGAGRVSGANLYRRRTERIALVAVAALALASAAAEPNLLESEAGDHSMDATKSVVLAIDVSASMQATDVAPTRLAQAVRIAGEILGRAEGNRVGLLLFAGKGYTLAPPTEDIQALRFLLRGVTPTIVSARDPGSLLSVGIREATALLSAEAESDTKVLVLLTDGEAGEADGEVAAAVREAVETVAVHTIGVGTLRGGEMSLPTGAYQMGGPVLDVRSVRGVSRLQQRVLRSIARDGGGQYARPEDGGGMRAIYRAVAPEERTRIPGVGRGHVDLTSVLATAGLVLLLLDSLLEVPTRGRRLVPAQRGV